MTVGGDGGDTGVGGTCRKSLRAGVMQRCSGCRRLLQAEGMKRRLVEEEDDEEVELKLLLNSSVRWPRWTSSSSSVESCWEAW